MNGEVGGRVMKVYAIRNNNRDYGDDDLKVYLKKEDADQECRSMIVTDIVNAIPGCEINNRFECFIQSMHEANEMGYDEMAAMDYAVADVLGGRCFVTEVEVQE